MSKALTFEEIITVLAADRTSGVIVNHVPASIAECSFVLTSRLGELLTERVDLGGVFQEDFDILMHLNIISHRNLHTRPRVVQPTQLTAFPGKRKLQKLKSRTKKRLQLFEEAEAAMQNYSKHKSRKAVCELLQQRGIELCWTGSGPGRYWLESLDTGCTTSTFYVWNWDRTFFLEEISFKVRILRQSLERLRTLRQNFKDSKALLVTHPVPHIRECAQKIIKEQNL